LKELLDKLSSYNLFNYLLPGTLFVAVARQISNHTFAQSNIVIEFFVYYFIGLVVSRIGSLIVEPISKWTKFVTFASYQDFVCACARDPHIEILSEQNNMFRTLCALFLALGVLRLYDAAVNYWALPGQTLVFSALFVMFAFAYRKQTGYVRRRVEAALRKD